MCDKCSNQKNGLLEGIVLGAIVGIGVYYFLGTDEGEKLQKTFKKKASPYLDEAADVLEELKDQSTDLLEKAQEVKETLEEKFEDKKEQIEDVVSDKLESSLSHIEELQERGREATATIRKRFFKNTKKPAA